MTIHINRDIKAIQHILNMLAIIIKSLETTTIPTALLIHDKVESIYKTIIKNDHLKLTDLDGNRINKVISTTQAFGYQYVQNIDGVHTVLTHRFIWALKSDNTKLSLVKLLDSDQLLSEADKLTFYVAFCQLNRFYGSILDRLHQYRRACQPKRCHSAPVKSSPYLRSVKSHSTAVGLDLVTPRYQSTLVSCYPVQNYNLHQSDIFKPRF